LPRRDVAISQSQSPLPAASRGTSCAWHDYCRPMCLPFTRRGAFEARCCR